MTARVRAPPGNGATLNRCKGFHGILKGLGFKIWGLGF